MQSSDQAPPRASAILPWLIAAGGIAGVRAGLIALQDDYFANGFSTLAIASFARHYSQGFALALAAGMVLLIARNHLGGVLRGLLFLIGCALGYAFVAGRLPHLPYHKPGFEGNSALVAQALCVLTAAIAMLVLSWQPKRPSRPRTFVAWLAVVTAIALPVVTRVSSSSSAAYPAKPNVILISLDTLRTDHMSCYGYERTTTPNIDRFAESGLRFTRAHAPHPWTLTSHMSMFTGLTPTEHGVDEDRRLSHEVPTLAELYEEAGYNTLALVDRVVWLDQRYGFARGFASYRRVYGSAADKIAMLDTVFDDLGSSPFFLFLHYFDAHSDVDGLPYDSAPKDFEELCTWYQGEFTGCVDATTCASETLMALNRGQAEIDADTERFIFDLYDAGIRTMDRELGLLFEILEERGLFENSIVVITSDHGEELRDHGQYLHGTHYQECVSVPLIFRIPGESTLAESPRLVSHVDLAPTLLELCGLDASPVGGRSFARLVAQGMETKRRLHILFDAGGGDLGARIDNWKLISNRGEPQLFDLDADPGEQVNLIAAEPAPRQLSELQGILETERERLRERARAMEAEDRGVQLSDREREELGNVGYAGRD